MQKLTKNLNIALPAATKLALCHLVITEQTTQAELITRLIQNYAKGGK